MGFLKISYNGFKKYRKRRKNLTIVLIGSFFLTFFFLSLFLTIYNNLWSYWVKDFTGGNIIVDKGLETFDLYAPVPPDNYMNYQDFLAVNKGIADQVSPRIRIGALFGNQSSDLESDSVPCIITGVDLAKENRLNEFISVADGRLFEPGKNEIILSETVVSDLKAKIGDRVIIYARTKDGYPNCDLLTVTGFYKLSSAASTLGQSIGFMPIDSMRELLMTDSNTASEVVYIPRATFSFSGFHSAGKYQLISGLSSFSLVRLLSIAFKFLAMVVFLLLFAFAVSSIYHNVVLMSAERTREIGVYLTFGAKPQWIRKIFLLELVIYTFYCAIFGGILSFLLVTGINSLGFYPIDIPTQMLMSSSHFVLRMDLPIFLYSLLILLGLVLIGSVRPIFRATGNERVVDLFNTLKR